MASAASTPSNDGWVEYRRLVLAELERISTALAKCEGQISGLSLSVSTAISEAKQNLTDKFVELNRKSEDERDKLIKELDKDFDKKLEELSKKLDKQTQDVSTLKAKAAMLGALAGFVVAVGGLLASIFLKH